MMPCHVSEMLTSCLIGLNNLATSLLKCIKFDFCVGKIICNNGGTWGTGHRDCRKIQRRTADTGKRQVTSKMSLHITGDEFISRLEEFITSDRKTKTSPASHMRNSQFYTINIFQHASRIIVAFNTSGLQGENECLRKKNDIAVKSYGRIRIILLAEGEGEGVTTAARGFAWVTQL